jgi:hypothetical protein
MQNFYFHGQVGGTAIAPEFKVLTNSYIYLWVFCSTISFTDYIAWNGVTIHKQ